MKVAAVIAALVLAAGSFQVGRPGYSVDEEFTEFAVRGILAHGLPLLPSGLLYDRGLAYSYAAATIGGRIVSLACASLIVMVTLLLVRRYAAASAGWLAATMVATSIPFWATATTARFYAPFLLSFLIALANLGSWRVLIAAAFVARLLHELAFLLPLVPLVCAIGSRGDRRKWLIATAAAVAGLLLGQLLLFGMHAIDPASGNTMVRRFFIWQVLNLFERPGERQFGIALIVMAAGVLLMPKRKAPWVVSALSATAMIAAYSIARASNSEPMSIAMVRATLAEGSHYPLDMFWHIARTTPLTLVLGIGTLAARAVGIGGEWRPAERAAHLIWIGWVLWFGVIESGITTNYLLLPLSFLLIAIAVDVAAIGRDQAARHVYAAFALIVVGVAVDQWRGEGPLAARLEAARPTIDVPGIGDIRATLQPTDRIVCTDELGCLMLVGRIDRWLALDDYVRERFLVRRSEAVVTGVYTGVPAVMRPAEVFSANADGTLPDRTIVIDIFKEYPIGNSRSWLPKAIEEDGLRVVPLLETAQVRILQVSPQERQASLQP